MDNTRSVFLGKYEEYQMKDKKLQEELKTLEQQALEIEARKNEILSIFEKENVVEELSENAIIKSILDDFSEKFLTQNISLSYKDNYWIATDVVSGKDIGYVKFKDQSLVRSYLKGQFLSYSLYKFLTSFFHDKEDVEISWGEKSGYEISFHSEKFEDKNRFIKIFAEFFSDKQEFLIEIEKNFYNLSSLELKLKENEDLFIFGEDSFVMVYSQKFTTNWSGLRATLQHAIQHFQEFPQNDSRFSI